MQIVIDIPEERYKLVKGVVDANRNKVYLPYEYELVADGTPLPKGHGRLIDADVACPNHTECVMCPIAIECSICAAPTIIEADKEAHNE